MRCGVLSWRSFLVSVGLLMFGLVAAVPLRAQTPAESPSPSSKSSEAKTPEVASPAEIELNFPENVPLKMLVDYVSERKGINIIYQPNDVGKRITIKATTKVSEDSLLGLLQSILKMNDLAMVDADQAGWKRIVPAGELIAIAQPPSKAGQEKNTDAVTQVLKISHVDVKNVDQIIKPFLSGRGANTVTIADQGLLIVTDYATNMGRINEIIQLIDRPGPPIEMQFVTVKHMEATALGQEAAQLLASKHRADKGTLRESRIEIKPSARTNQLALIGSTEDIAEASAVIASLDVALDMKSQMYQFDVVAPERMDRLIKELIGPVVAQTQYRSAIDKEANLLIVTATAAVHEQIAKLKTDLDVTPTEGQSPVRFYKLENRTADDVLRIIQGIEGDEGLTGLSVDDASAPPAKGEGKKKPLPAPSSVAGDGGYQSLYPAAATPLLGQPAHRDAAGGSAIRLHPSIQTARARVTADTDTNTIIVVADPAVQREYERLIKLLDRRRPQVLIEVTLVTLDTTNGYSLGVELSRMGSADNGRVLTFSSFGLSDVDEDTGALTIRPGLGFNGALIGADIGDIVIRALQSDAKAEVVSAPRILVNDNSSGSLSSVNEAPFTSVNASSTVATTSFAGYASAGTTIAVTPHISEDDYLQLEYQITLNSFTGQGSDDLPPPRQTNTVQSKVTIPDGSMIIIGGLKRKDSSDTVNSIPGIGKIPILNLLAGNQTRNTVDSTLFVFMRPIILRDDEFADLKYLSQRDLAAAGQPDEYPHSEGLLIR